MTPEEKMNFTTTEFYRQHGDNNPPPKRGAVLVFLPGYLEIDTLYKQLVELSVTKAG
jgi:HrpA-like RNA helicase